MERKLKFRGKTFMPDIRKSGDMENVVFDKKWLEESGKDLPVYFMYRGLINKSGLRYDVTIIPFVPFGQELPKTLGHYHSFASSGYRYPEVYEVVDGNAIFLLQKLSGGRVTEVFAVAAGKNDKVVVPPGYGHITVNAGPKALRLANWMAVASSSDYKPIVKKCGGAYFALKAGRGIKWVKNGRYGKLPLLKKTSAKNFSPKIIFGKKLAAFASDTKALEFLKNPSKYKELWK